MISVSVSLLYTSNDTAIITAWQYCHSHSPTWNHLSGNYIFGNSICWILLGRFHKTMGILHGNMSKILKLSSACQKERIKWMFRSNQLVFASYEPSQIIFMFNTSRFFCWTLKNLFCFIEQICQFIDIILQVFWTIFLVFNLRMQHTLVDITNKVKKS